jgi:hypothetical protein
LLYSRPRFWCPSASYSARAICWRKGTSSSSVVWTFQRLTRCRCVPEGRLEVLASSLPCSHRDCRAHRPQTDQWAIRWYFKEGRGLRTEGTFHDRGDFGVNKGIENMPYLKTLDGQINRRLLEVERVSQNCGLGTESIQRVVEPTVAQDGQRAPSLKFGDRG